GLGWAYADGRASLRLGVRRAALALLLVGIPATAMGATFPIAVASYAGGAADAGRLYAVNTAGAAIGSLATGFVLIPAIGVRATTWLGIALNLLAAARARWLAAHRSVLAIDAPAAPAKASRASGTD